MFRKRRQPTPHFRLPPPYQPITGEHAPLVMQGVFPYCAMMQIAAEDTKTNYVLCRGFDVRISRFIDYEAGNADKPGIAVAKPYGSRRAGVYQIAQVYAALLPLQTTNPSPTSVDWRVRQNPGVAESQGHPQYLQEKIDELYDDNGVLINWFFVEAPATAAATLVELCAQATATRNVPYDCLLGTWDPAQDLYCYDGAPTVKAIDHRYGMALAETGWKGLYMPESSDTYGTIYVCVSLDCALPPEGCSC